MPLVTMADVAKHNTLDDNWIVVGSKAYNVPKAWVMNKHPGGWLPLKNMAGKDATDPFVQYHPNFVYAQLENFHVANVVAKDVKESAFVKEHRAIRQTMLEAGMYRTDYTFYYWIVARLMCMFGLMLHLTINCTSWWAHLGGAFMLGFFW
jgi:cytochrome b involved in lipid metabolism